MVQVVNISQTFFFVILFFFLFFFFRLFYHHPFVVISTDPHAFLVEHPRRHL